MLVEGEKKVFFCLLDHLLSSTWYIILFGLRKELLWRQVQLRNKEDRIKMESWVEFWISIYKACLTPKVQREKSYDMLEPHGLNKVWPDEPNLDDFYRQWEVNLVQPDTPNVMPPKSIGLIICKISDLHSSCMARLRMACSLSVVYRMSRCLAFRPET